MSSGEALPRSSRLDFMGCGSSPPTWCYGLTYALLVQYVLCLLGIVTISQMPVASL